MPNQIALGRTGEDTWVAALIVPEMFTDLSSRNYQRRVSGGSL